MSLWSHGRVRYGRGRTDYGGEDGKINELPMAEPLLHSRELAKCAKEETRKNNYQLVLYVTKFCEIFGIFHEISAKG